MLFKLWWPWHWEHHIKGTSGLFSSSTASSSSFLPVLACVPVFRHTWPGTRHRLRLRAVWQRRTHWELSWWTYKRSSSIWEPIQHKETLARLAWVTLLYLFTLSYLFALPCSCDDSSVSLLFMQERSLSWDSSQEMSCDSPPFCLLRRPRLRRMNALPPSCSNSLEHYKVSIRSSWRSLGTLMFYEWSVDNCIIIYFKFDVLLQQYTDNGFSSARSSLVEPPGSESLRRRETDPEIRDHRWASKDNIWVLLLYRWAPK